MKAYQAILGVVVICGNVFAVDEPMGVERLARLTKPGYQVTALSEGEPVWLQVDLGDSKSVDRVKLFPVVNVFRQSQGYPLQFRIEASEDSTFTTSTMIADQTTTDVVDPEDKVGIYEGNGVKARFIRLTATKLRDRQLWLTKFEVWSKGKDVAEGRPVSDSRRGDLGVTLLTRSPRPQGENVVTDNPENVIPAEKWKPAKLKARAPISGVTMHDKLIKTAMENNIGYLLSTGTPDVLLKYFRDRAGKPNPTGTEVPATNWDNVLRGSNAGRFMMGAGSTLRFMEHQELRKRLNEVVDGIHECRRDDGFIMAYPEDTIFESERGGYTRSWVTQGLIEAGRAGNEKAYPLLRGFYDWFNKSPYLPELLRRGGYGIQGFIANTLMYNTPEGKPEDLLVGQRYFQENYWLDGLAGREETAVWRYPYSHSHCYLLTAVEPYLDLYIATGEKKYLEASLGTWEMYHDKWEHIGGGIAICEGSLFPPKSYVLNRNTGELCGNVFWARFSQRFHLLDPENEKYVAEIEKSIYNVALANQTSASAIRYHAHLVGKKEKGDAFNSCCEGQGTRFYGTLPEYVYSISDDGLYVNLFAASTIKWKQSGLELQVSQVTEFPYSPDVAMEFTSDKPAKCIMHIRTPGWATKGIEYLVNGEKAATGKPGSYVSINRTWSSGDKVSFQLPMELKMSRYSGVNEVRAGARFALEYGPVLMALTGMKDGAATQTLSMTPEELVKSLERQEDKPLHFVLPGEAGLFYRPYWEVMDEPFTCFPTFTKVPSNPEVRPEPGNLALASLGTTVTADSELAGELGCVVMVIDGIVESEGSPKNRWHASVETSLPHWIEVKLSVPKMINRVAVRFASDPQGYPVSFQGLLGAGQADKIIMDETDHPDWKGVQQSFPPVFADTFRFVIRESANNPFPTWTNHVSAAQISEVELYGPEMVGQAGEQ